MFDYEYWGNETLPASANMALEYFFLRRAAAYKTACIRFFSVPKDAVILGYAQATDALKKRDSSFDVARRLTGGSHVQIGSNILAYSFAVPRDGTFRTYEDMRAYFADHVAAALESIGVENIAVDNRASTINVGGKVVASHAVIWGVESALLHGLIVVDNYDMEKISERVFLAERKIGSKKYSEYAALKRIPAVCGITKAAKASTDRTEAVKGILADSILATVARGRFRKMAIDKRTFEECTGSKHASGTWISCRKPPFEEREIEEIPGEELDGKLKRNLGYCLYSQVRDKDFKRMAELV